MNLKPIILLNKIFEPKMRLGIMTILMLNDTVCFNELKVKLNATDGNLASHLKNLEEVNYIDVEKSFVGKKTNTEYSATKLGKKEFKMHLTNLEKLIKLL